MKSLVLALLVAVAGSAACPAQVQAQAASDTAAVVLDIAQRFRAAGDEATARTLLEYLRRQYPGTVAAAEADRLLLAMRGAPRPERPGRTELMVWSATYGAWVGVAVPLLLDAAEPEAIGLGLLLGTPAGFMAGRAYANQAMLTEGQARAMTFGGTWGTYQGFGWGEALRIGDRVDEECLRWQGPHADPDWCRQAHGPTRVAIGLLGGLAGIGTGALLARRPRSAGTAAAVSTSALWGTWFGWGAGFLGGMDDRPLLTTTLLAGNAALLAAGVIAPEWDVSESRVRLVSVGGLIGGLTGLGIALIVQPEGRAWAAIPLVTSAVGLGMAVQFTRDWDETAGQRRGDAGAAGAGGALVNLEGGRWSLDLPNAAMMLERSDDGVRPAVRVPLLKGRF
jgi:hypothetical protein